MKRRLGSLIRLPIPDVEPEHDDSALVRAFCIGETWAARAIWSRHSPMVFRLFERALGPNADAEDLTQDAFLSTFGGLHALRDHRALRSFIYSVALRILKWELRRRRVRRVLQLFPIDQLPDWPARAVDVEARQVLVRFYSLLDRLNVNERTAFVLRHMEEFTLEEVAERMGVSLSTAKRVIRSASLKVSALVAADRELSEYWSQRGGVHARD
ncbi:MAG: RNA polymerase sigma factor [Polyangiaceae bacterium]